MELDFLRLRKVRLGLIATIFIGMSAASIVFFNKSKSLPEISQGQLQELRESFPEFLSDRLKKEKKDSKLLKVDIVSMSEVHEGMVKIAYSILFDDLVHGIVTPSSVDATATLRREKDIWKVVSILTQKESFDLQD
jgi:hypothetical protein